MNQTISLSEQVKQYLPPQILEVVEFAGEKAAQLQQGLYLVGGVVRDLFLGLPNFDLDLVVEGDALKLASEIARFTQASLLRHPRFATAKLKLANFSIDIATARKETYSKPGALPAVTPGTIHNDLFRRDFSINAMAICLIPERYGELLDPYKGKDDLNRHLIRVLHDQSFIDDATRILRGLRYEQRLGFSFEPRTLELLQRDIFLLDTISNDRIRHELELILREDEPERILKRAQELEILRQLCLPLKGNGWLAQKFEQARQISKHKPTTFLYLSLLIYPLTESENEQFLSRINPTKKLAQTLRDTLRLKKYLSYLSEPSLSPSSIYYLLHNYPPTAIQANAIASDSISIRQRLELFLRKLRYVKSILNGEDLIRIGISPGPKMGDILRALHEAKLNGRVKTRIDEEKFVYSWLSR